LLSGDASFAISLHSQQQQQLVCVGDRTLDKLERGSNRCVIDLTWHVVWENLWLSELWDPSLYNLRSSSYHVRKKEAPFQSLT